MTRMSAPTPSGIPTPGKVVASGAVVLAMTVACVAGLDGLIQPGAWRWTVGAILAIVTAVIVAARLALRRWAGPDVSTAASLTPSLAGLAAGLWLLAARFGGSAPRATSGDLDPVVTLENFRGLARLARTVEEIAVTTIAPIQPLEAIVALFAAGACLVLVLMDMFVAVRVPALAGLATSLLWLPSLMIVGDVATWSVVAVTALLLVLLAVDRPSVATARTGRATAREAAIPVAGAGLTVTAVVAAGLAVSLVLPSLPWRGAVSAPDLRTGVANLTDDLDLRRSLQEQSTREVLTYTVSEGAPPVGPLRTTSLLDFDGRQWLPSDPDTEPARPGDLLWPSLAEGSSATSFALRMQFEGLASSTVPVPLEPRMITSDREMSYDASRDAVDVADRLSSGDSLEMTVMPRNLDPDRLRAGSPLEPSQGFPNRFADPELMVPETSHAPEIARLAYSVVGDVDNQYDAAVALQDYLRTSPEFNYSLSVPAPTSDDAVWDFLQDGTGYCVQFASAMTIMARTLGIPARMSIGYLPGTVGADGVAVVRGRDAHAWPEIYFDDVGWVRFEPTPALQSGALPTYAATATETPTPTATETPTPTSTSQRPTSSTTSGTSTTATATAATSSSSGANGALVASLLVVLVVAAGLTVMLVRRRAVHVHVRDVEDAWSTIVRAARTGGIEIDPAATLRATAAHVVPGGEAVGEVARRVEVARYAPAAPAADREELDGLVRAALDEVQARVSALAAAENRTNPADAGGAPGSTVGDADRGGPRA